jgi:hypothetical protein
MWRPRAETEGLWAFWGDLHDEVLKSHKAALENAALPGEVEEVPTANLKHVQVQWATSKSPTPTKSCASTTKKKTINCAVLQFR